MEEITNIGFRELVKRAEPEQRYNDELLLVKLEDIGPNPPTPEVLPDQFEGYFAIIVTEGEASVTVDYVQYTLRKGMVLELLIDNTVQNFNLSPDIKGYQLVIVRDFFLALLKEYGPPPPKVMNFLRLTPVIQPEEKDFCLLVDTLDRLQANIIEADHYYRYGLIANEVRNFTMRLRNLGIKKYSNTQPSLEVGKYEELLIKFMKLISKHCREKHDVTFYATELCVTPVYLSRAVKALSGKTVISWIRDSIMIEAKLMLRKPNASIQKVAEDLHFSDQSAFGKFFKKHTGLSPFEYKQSFTK